MGKEIMIKINPKIYEKLTGTERKRAYSIEYNRLYRQSPKGKTARAKYNQSLKRKITQTKYNQSIEGKIVKAKANAKYRQSPKGKIVRARINAKYEKTPKGKTSKIRYLQSPKGKARSARYYSKRRAYSTNPNLFTLRIKQLHEDKEPCAVCGAPYQSTYQIDHIVALCNGGTDVWSNLQPICKTCHKIKTGNDLSFYYRNNSEIYAKRWWKQIQNEN